MCSLTAHLLDGHTSSSIKMQLYRSRLMHIPASASSLSQRWPWPSSHLLQKPTLHCWSQTDWGQLQAGVKQIRTKAKWISCLPLRASGMRSVSPDHPVCDRSIHLLKPRHSGCWWNGIIYPPDSCSLSPQGKSTHIWTGLVFIAGICSAYAGFSVEREPHCSSCLRLLLSPIPAHTPWMVTW